MAVFTYRASDATAADQSGTITADTPRQARDLYIRNPVRVIPNVGYAPAPLTPARRGRFG